MVGREEGEEIKERERAETRASNLDFVRKLREKQNRTNLQYNLDRLHSLMYTQLNPHLRRTMRSQIREYKSMM